MLYMESVQFIIIMNGHTACLKTYTARRLANVLKVLLVETNKLGRCTNPDGLLNDEFRELRYNTLFGVVRQLLARGESVVADGTFTLRRRRNVLYSLCKEFNIQ